MNIEELLEKYKGYLKGIEIKDNYYLISFTLQDGWRAFVNNEKIKIGSKEGVYFLYAMIEDVKLDELFESLDEMIRINLEASRKKELYKSKIEELLEIFTEEPLEVLETISFTFKEKRRGRKPKKSKKEEIDEKPTEEISEDKETNSEEKEEDIIISGKDIDNILPSGSNLSNL